MRGKNKLKNVKFLPGDQVIIEPIKDGQGVIERLLPRKNCLIRPPIANIDQVFIVNALAKPEPDLRFIDRLTVLALYNKVEPIICFNKKDLGEEAMVKKLKDIYQKAGFQVVFCSVKLGLGIDKIKELLKNKKSVFAGLSGVGKSSLLNAIQPNLALQTGGISKKLKRGKHTTRHVELLSLEFGGLVADTPGFSSLDLSTELEKEQLGLFFPEFKEFSYDCKFNTCLHNNEPNCAVKEGVATGIISENRYNNYLLFLKEVMEKERRY